MGNKVGLAARVASIIEPIDPDRPLIDLFGGMCSVAGAVAPSGRQVIVNDVQSYARLVASCLIASQNHPPKPQEALAALVPAYRDNLAALRDRFDVALRDEHRILVGASLDGYRAAQAAWRHVGNDEALAVEATRLRTNRAESPHRLATITFAWGYFGLQQAIELDSLRAGIDTAAASGRLSPDQAAWCRLALLQVASRVASAPGHFAQYLRGESPAALRRIIAARRRSVFDGFFDDLSHLRPYGSAAWRQRNRVFRQDALRLWCDLDDATLGPSIFYADPPYSKEHYSRFYHVLETLERYDYPPAVGVGRYRPDRFVTALGTKRGVVAALGGVCHEIAVRNGILVLSYPSSGLLTRALGVDPADLLGEHFRHVELAIREAQHHSTLGGRHGDAWRPVTEYVWIAR